MYKMIVKQRTKDCDGCPYLEDVSGYRGASLIDIEEVCLWGMWLKSLKPVDKPRKCEFRERVATGEWTRIDLSKVIEEVVGYKPGRK